MLLIYIAAGIIVFIGLFLGHQPYLRLEDIFRAGLLNLILALAGFFTLLMIAYYFGYFPQTVAAPVMIFIYSLLAGFFAGYAWRLFNLRAESGTILYVCRSFWIDLAPGFAAMLVILYGIYRTSLLLEQPVTGIRLTSGVSLITFGIFFWTLKVVPEFRSRGILFLDRIIPWELVIAWKWHSEEVIGIEYIQKPGKPDEQVQEFFTAIPADERKEIESVLDSKMDEHRTAREKLLLRR